ncbi:MAG: NAD(P)/FAD-dependent oxidoreductase [Longimicrobiales bacterium]
MGLNRRDFLKISGLQAGALAAGASPRSDLLAEEKPPQGAPGERPQAPSIREGRPEVAVIGAGCFGVWTAYYLRERGVNVLLVDQYGPGNSRATSGGETRGVRSGYRDNVLWTEWANRAIERWNEWNTRWIEECGTQLFFPTGDLTLREDWDNFATLTRDTWDELGVAYDLLSAEEVSYRWPWIDAEGVGVALYEYQAGVVRARKACEQVWDMYTDRLGGTFELQRVELGRTFDGRLADIVLHPSGDRINADQYIFAVGPWFPYLFPELLGEDFRIPIGHVYYFGIEPGDNRFRYPNMPSYNVPGVTGWPALPPDSKGLRVRTGGRDPQHPDESSRYIPGEFLEQPREVLREWFPELAEAPLTETRACHYEFGNSGEFMIDRHPDMRNVWLFGAGNAEGFKFSPILGEYMAQRALGEDPHADVSDRFRLLRNQP